MAIKDEVRLRRLRIHEHSLTYISAPIIDPTTRFVTSKEFSCLLRLKPTRSE